MLESKIQKEIIKYLKSKEHIVLRLREVSPIGCPDLLCVTKEGNHVYIEVKKEGGRLSSVQEYMHKALKEYNCEVYTVYSLEEVKEIL